MEIEKSGGVQLINGEAFAELAKIPSGSVDMVLTDPPYGTTHAAWDKAPDWSALFAELWRVLKSNGALLMFSQMPVAADIVAQQRKNFRYQWIWEKTKPVGFFNARRMPMRVHEVILVFYRSLPIFNAVPIASQRGKPYKSNSLLKPSTIYGRANKANPIESKDGRRFPRDVVRNSIPPNSSRLHPTQKPEDLLSMLIGQYTQPGELVLDPFAGSGSTLKAAQLTGRMAIGIEMDEEYCRRARIWLESAEMPLKRARKSRRDNLSTDGEQMLLGLF